MSQIRRFALAGVVGLTALCAAAAPAHAGLVLVAGPDQGTFSTNNFGFGATGVGTAANANANYYSGPVVGSETYGSHLNNAPVSLLFVFGANGQISTYADSQVGAYDNSDDTQIGVLNRSGGTLTSFMLTSATSGPFAFDGDGISGGYSAPSNASDKSTGLYGGPLTYFTLNAPGSAGNFQTTNSSSIFANFLGGLPNGSSTYFSLEGNPSSLTSLGGGGGMFTVPEPASMTIAATGALMLLACSWLRRPSGPV
jgi:hypothetical protein